MSITLQKKLDYYFTPVETIYSSTQNYGFGEVFSHSGTYTPSDSIGLGTYRLRYEIIKPDDKKEIRYSNFSYKDSNVGVHVYPIPGIGYEGYLEMNQTYAFKVNKTCTESGFWTFCLEKSTILMV